MLVPENLLYTKEHEWVRVEGNLAAIGISDYAQSSLGDITFVEAPSVGTEVKQFEYCATVESVKAASDVYAPVSGKVVTTNHTLTEHPEFVNQSPYEKGWFAVVEMEDEKETNVLMTSAQYSEYVKGLS